MTVGAVSISFQAKCRCQWCRLSLHHLFAGSIYPDLNSARQYPGVPKFSSYVQPCDYSPQIMLFEMLLRSALVSRRNDLRLLHLTTVNSLHQCQLESLILGLLEQRFAHSQKNLGNWNFPCSLLRIHPHVLQRKLEEASVRSIVVRQ